MMGSFFQSHRRDAENTEKVKLKLRELGASAVNLFISILRSAVAG